MSSGWDHDLENRTLSPVVRLFIEHLRVVAKSMFAPAKARKG
jgi:hypothetical protein